MSKRKENSTNTINRRILNERCGFMYALDIIGGRWKLLILYKLEKRKMRYSELMKVIPNISTRMLALQLKELERDHLIRRHVFAEVPVRVEYELTEAAHKLSDMWHSLENWGDEHRFLHEKSNEESAVPPKQTFGR